MYNVTDPIPAGIAIVTFVTFPCTMSWTQSQLGLLRSGDLAYAGVYSHRPIPAGIAIVTFVTFPHTMSQTQSQLGLLQVGTWLMLVCTAADQSQLGLLQVGTQLMPVCTAADQSQLGLLLSLL